MAGREGQPRRRRRRSGRRSLSVVAAVVLGAATLAGCASAEETGPPGTRVTSWLTSASGGTAIGTVSVDSRNVNSVLAHHNTAGSIRAACGVLTTDAQTAIGNLPTPDQTLTQDLNRAYEAAAAAGSDCYNGAGTNAQLMARSARERAELPGLLDVAVDRISALTGRVPSTSTTAPTDDGGDPFAP